MLATETIHTIKPQIFTLWPLQGKSANVWYKQADGQLKEKLHCTDLKKR